MANVGKTMSFLPPMTGNGSFIPPIKMVMTGGWFVIVLVFMTPFMECIISIIPFVPTYSHL